MLPDWLWLDHQFLPWGQGTRRVADRSASPSRGCEFTELLNHVPRSRECPLSPFVAACLMHRKTNAQTNRGKWTVMHLFSFALGFISFPIVLIGLLMADQYVFGFLEATRRTHG
jgi:hypothetical protein